MSASSKKMKNPKKKECEKGCTEDQSSDTMTFPFNLCDCTGEIDRYISEDGGLITCTIKRQKKSVIFFRDCIFINGCSAYHVVNLQDVLKIGTTVSFDAKKVCLDIGEGTLATCKVYQASLVWIGPKPRLDKSLNVKKVDYMRRLSCAMNINHCLSDPDLQSIYSPVYLTHLHVSSHEDERDVLKIGERFKVDLPGRVLGYISDTEGILLCEISGIPQGVLFNIENLYLNERKCTSEKRLASCVKYNAELFCNAIKLEKLHTAGVAYQASCVWNSTKPTISLLFEKFLKSPAEPAVKLRTDTIYDGVVMKISPPGMALVIVEGKNKAIPVLLFSKHFSLERDGPTLSEDSFIADYIDEYSVLELKIESFKGRFSANKIQNIFKAWKSEKSIDKLGNCIKQYILQVGDSPRTILPPAGDKSNKKVPKNIVKTLKNCNGLSQMKTEMQLTLQKGDYKISANFKSSDDSSDSSEISVNKKSDIMNDDTVTKAVCGVNVKKVNGDADRSTSQSPVSPIPEESPHMNQNDVDSMEMPVNLKGIPGKIIYITDSAGIIECNIHKKNIKVVFHKTAVCFTSNPKPLKEHFPVGKIVQLDMKKIHWSFLSNTPTYRVTSLWVGKRPKNPVEVVKSNMSTLIPNHIYKAKVTECRPPTAFVSEIVESDTKYNVFVFNFVLRIQNRMLQKNESIAPYIQVGDEVNLIVKKNENLCDGFVWEATEAWKANQNATLSNHVMDVFKGKLVRVKKDQGTLEYESKVLRTFYRRNAYLLGIPLKNFNLTDVLVKGDTVNYKFIKEGSDEQILKVWIGLQDDNHHLEDEDIMLFNVYNYCVIRDISLPVIQKLTEEHENLQIAINKEKKELILASKNTVSNITEQHVENLVTEEDSVGDSLQEENEMNTDDTANSYCGGDVYMSDEEVVDYGEIYAGLLEQNNDELFNGAEAAKSVDCTAGVSEEVNKACTLKQINDPFKDSDKIKDVQQIDGASIVKEVDGASTVKEVEKTSTVGQVDGASAIQRADGASTVQEVEKISTVEQVDEAIVIQEIDGASVIQRVDGGSTAHKVFEFCAAPNVSLNDTKCDDGLISSVGITDTRQTKSIVANATERTESPQKVSSPDMKMGAYKIDSKPVIMIQSTYDEIFGTARENVKVEVPEEVNDSVCSSSIMTAEKFYEIKTVEDLKQCEKRENKNLIKENVTMNKAIASSKLKAGINTSKSVTPNVSTAVTKDETINLEVKKEAEVDVSFCQENPIEVICKPIVENDLLEKDTIHLVDTTSGKKIAMESNIDLKAQINTLESIIASLDGEVCTESLNVPSDSDYLHSEGNIIENKPVVGNNLPKVKISFNPPEGKINKVSCLENGIIEGGDIGMTESKVDSVSECETCPNLTPNDIQEQTSQTMLSVNGSIKSEDDSDFQSAIESVTTEDRSGGSDVCEELKENDSMSVDSSVAQNLLSELSDEEDEQVKSKNNPDDEDKQVESKNNPNDEDKQIESENNLILNMDVNHAIRTTDIDIDARRSKTTTPEAVTLSNPVLNADFEKALKEEMLAKCNISPDDIDTQMEHLSEKVKNFCLKYLNNLNTEENVTVKERDELATPTPESKETVDTAVQTLSTGDIMYSKLIPS